MLLRRELAFLLFSLLVIQLATPVIVETSDGTESLDDKLLRKTSNRRRGKNKGKKERKLKELSGKDILKSWMKEEVPSTNSYSGDSIENELVSWKKSLYKPRSLNRGPPGRGGPPDKGDRKSVV